MNSQQIIDDLWRFYPHTFAEKVSYGRWKPYNYLKIVSERLAKAIAKGGGRFIVEIPPRHGKSELISKYVPAWFLEHTKHQNIILCSYESDFASHWGRSVRNVLEQSEYLNCKITGDSSAANRFSTTQGGMMITAGVGGPITGRGGHLVIVDDPVKNQADALSEVKRKSAIEWWKSTLYTRLEPNATVIVLQTRWHQNDLAGWLQSPDNENYRDWQVIRFPAIAEENDPLGREIGQPLCPERYSLEALADLKRSVGSFWWSALYQQRPTPQEGGIVKRHWFKFYTELPKKFDSMLQSWDLAFKDTSNSDYVVGQVLGRVDADRYLVDQVRDRLGFNETLKAIRNLSSKWPQAQLKLIEDKANGPAVMQTLKHEISGIVPVEPKGSKEARLHSVSPQIEAGNFYLPHPSIAPWISGYIEEFIGFPNMANDDQVDATSQGLERLSDNKRVNIYVM